MGHHLRRHGLSELAPGHPWRLDGIGRSQNGPWRTFRFGHDAVAPEHRTGSLEVASPDHRGLGPRRPEAVGRGVERSLGGPNLGLAWPISLGGWGWSTFRHRRFKVAKCGRGQGLCHGGGESRMGHMVLRHPCAGTDGTGGACWSVGGVDRRRWVVVVLVVSSFRGDSQPASLRHVCCAVSVHALRVERPRAPTMVV